MAASGVMYFGDGDEDIPQDLICPVCMSLPEAEVYQCKDGHLVCSNCYFNLRKRACPTCRCKLKEPIRNRFFEAKAAAYVQVDCSFKQNGCHEMMRKELQHDHEERCKFNFRKFGNLVSLCGIMKQRCGFKFNSGNTEEAVAHFASVHGAIITKKERFAMDIVDFKEDMENLSASEDYQFCTPVIVDLPDKKGYILCCAVSSGKADLFNWHSYFLPYSNADLSVPTDLKMKYSVKNELENEPELSVIQDVALINQACERGNISRGVSTGVRLNLKMSQMKPFINQEGSLLVNCRVEKDSSMNEEVTAICRNITKTWKAKNEEPISWNPFQATDAAKKYVQQLKNEFISAPESPTALQTIKDMCDRIKFQSNLFPTEFDRQTSYNMAGLALFTIVSFGSVEALKEILTVGLNLDIAKSGKTPLHCAMRDKNLERGVEKAKLLLAGGANLTALDGSQATVLHWTAFARNHKAVAFFIKEGLPVNLVDGEGRTPLHYALINNPVDATLKVVKLLLNNGADKNAMDKLGRTPWDYSENWDEKGKLRRKIEKQFKKSRSSDQLCWRFGKLSSSP